MPKPPLSPYLLPSSADAPASDPPPRPRAAMSLGAAELLLVGAFRAWVAPLVRPGAPHPDWREIFVLARLDPATTVAFDAMMSILAAQARRLIAVPCCACPGVGEDEAAAIRLFAALQRRDLPPALDILGDWLAPEAVEPALRAAQRVAIGMADGGLVLPSAAALPPTATLH